MTLEERRQVLHIICDLEDAYRWRQVYKAFLETIVITQTLPPGNWHEGCELIANNPQAKEILATPFSGVLDQGTIGPFSVCYRPLSVDRWDCLWSGLNAPGLEAVLVRKAAGRKPWGSPAICLNETGPSRFACVSAGRV